MATWQQFESEGREGGDFHLFLLDLTEAVRTPVAGDHLVIETWRPGLPVRRVERG